MINNNNLINRSEAAVSSVSMKTAKSVEVFKIQFWCLVENVGQISVKPSAGGTNQDGTGAELCVCTMCVCVRCVCVWFCCFVLHLKLWTFLIFWPFVYRNNLKVPFLFQDIFYLMEDHVQRWSLGGATAGATDSSQSQPVVKVRRVLSVKWQLSLNHQGVRGDVGWGGVVTSSVSSFLSIIPVEEKQQCVFKGCHDFLLWNTQIHFLYILFTLADLWPQGQREFRKWSMCAQLRAMVTVTRGAKTECEYIKLLGPHVARMVFHTEKCVLAGLKQSHTLWSQKYGGTYGPRVELEVHLIYSVLVWSWAHGTNKPVLYFRSFRRWSLLFLVSLRVSL